MRFVSTLLRRVTPGYLFWRIFGVSICLGNKLAAETPSIKEYIPLLYEARKKAKDLGREFVLYLHAGESTSKDNDEMYHAIQIGTKRIGH